MDPFEKKIPPALLSAEHIEQYALATGMIAPFDASDRCGALKKASYECRIGRSAFRYDERGHLQRLDVSACKGLMVKANSIVFIESDIDFRLPDFIAMRFNLRIRHVHRGLLLGTGPLVDPGYWGKLCVPLHNLTDEDHFISLDEGLIWLEFTKISLGEKYRTTRFLAKRYGHGRPPCGVQ